MLAGFIVGFDSDDATIFERQREFIELTAITWAMAGVLQAPPTTPLYDRMKREGRLHEDSEALTNFSPPNFDTVLPVPVLLRGLSTLLSGLYEAKPFFERALRSLEVWQPRASQNPPNLPMAYNLRVLAASMWRQGIRSPYKQEYWKFLYQLIRRYARQPAKLWLGFMVLLSAHHFLHLLARSRQRAGAGVRGLRKEAGNICPARSFARSSIEAGRPRLSSAAFRHPAVRHLDRSGRAAQWRDLLFPLCIPTSCCIS